ncbi:MAG: TIGR00303 family protein, partial [Cyanobacteria bacterium J06648_11]
MVSICSETGGGRARAWLSQYRGRRPAFACILSFTETALIPQVSAAGKSAEARRYTAAADGEFLLRGASFTPQNSQGRGL